MRESSDEHNAPEEPKSSTEKKIKLSRYFPGDYFRIIIKDLFIAIIIIVGSTLLSGFIHLISTISFFHFMEEKLTYFEEAHFWLSFVTFLIFPVFSIYEIIVAKFKELKNHDDN